MRKPFQGVWNIIRFNWHFYILSTGFIVLAVALNNYLTGILHCWIDIIVCLLLFTTAVSLLVSWYIYDISGLYNLSWLDKFITGVHNKIVNINAGFDETSILFQNKFNNSELHAFDFYDKERHTEVSIKRARKAYPHFPGTAMVTTSHLPLQNDSIDKVFAFLSAHEIRDEQERVVFFKELGRIVKASGRIIVTEHLRDIPNFLAYNIGFLHFHSKTSWLNTFKESGLRIEKEIKNTTFISTFILVKDATTA